MIEINNNDPENKNCALQYMTLSKIFTTTGITIFMVYFIKRKYDYISLFTTENSINNNYPINMYNNQRFLNGTTKESPKITIGNLDDDVYITLYTVSINILSGSAKWYEAIYNQINTIKSEPIIFPNVTSFTQDSTSNYIIFGGTYGWEFPGAFSGNIGEILVYDNFLDPTSYSVSSVYNQNVSYLRNKWNI